MPETDSTSSQLLLGPKDLAFAWLSVSLPAQRTGHLNLIEHGIATLISQHIVGLALCYKDLYDHDPVRHDPGAGRSGR